MKDKNNQDAPPNSDAILREIRDVVMDIHNILLKSHSANNDRADPANTGVLLHHIVDEVYLDKETVLDLLMVSESTLAQWRYKKCIKYRNRGTKLIDYKYADIIEALSHNRLTARGFNAFAAYKRMLEWYQKNIENPMQK